MNEVITNHLDLWTSALLTKSSAGRGSNGKQEAYGIKKLRELILELAVRGKLVPQDPNDEPAAELLKRVAADKARMVKEGKIRKEKDFPPIADDEILFNLPKGWEWARINTVGHDWGQKTPDATFTYIDVSAIDNSSGVISSPTVLSASDAPSRARKIVQRGTVIYSTVRPYLKNICVIEEDYEPEPIASTAFAILHPLQGMPGRFFAFYFRSPEFVKYVESVQTGIAYPAINDKQFYGGLVPIPPLVEQHRIVAKVDELMALCDQLEQQQTHSLEAHQTLVETLLGTLTSVASPQELTEAWTRIANHFDTLFTTEHSIDQLKQTILQLAVMGKLVPQDPNDEPASVLLKSARRDRERLAKEGLRKEVTLPAIASDEEPFPLPARWAWLRFGEMGEVIGGGTPSKSNPRYWGGQIPWVSPKDMKVDFISESIDTISEEAIEGSAVKLVPAGSLLIVVRGMILAHSFPVAITRVPVTVNQDMKAIVIDGFDKNYILLMVKALKNDFVSLVDRSTHGTCKLVSEKLWAKVLPIPPAAEQHRIVAKVDELTALCDALKARIKDAQTTQLHLADAIVEKAVA